MWDTRQPPGSAGWDLLAESAVGGAHLRAPRGASTGWWQAEPQAAFSEETKRTQLFVSSTVPLPALA